MYTPRGELNDEFLQALYDGKLLEGLKKCREKKDFMRVLKQYVENMEYEELEESMVVLQSYLEEEQEMRILSDEDLDEVAGGNQRARIFDRSSVTGLLDRNPKAVAELRGVFDVLSRSRHL